MSVNRLFSQPEVPPLQAIPDRQTPEVSAAKATARRRLGRTGRRATILGGRTGGAESVARKTLLGE